MFTPGDIRKRLEQNSLESEPDKGRRAAVAMILIGAPQAEELLFIRRAHYQGDPWSGDVAFPGGGVEARDTDSRATAERETCEEIGLVLPDEAYLGMLGSINGAYLPVSIACHLYQLAERPTLESNHEVFETFFIPLSVLLEPERNQEHNFEYRGEQHTHPTIDLEGYCEHFLWGISYRLLQKFFVTLGINLIVCLKTSPPCDAAGAAAVIYRVSRKYSEL
jgi:8-oxo-dGTP pyrophosphatase MutT (NUDIX family)